MAFEKTDQFIYLIIQKIDLFIYCNLIFIPIYCWSLDKYNVLQSIHWIPREQAAMTNLKKKKNMHLPGSQKSGAFHIRMQKNRVSHTLFVEKRRLIIYLAPLKKGAIWHAHPYYVIYRKFHPPPPPPPLRMWYSNQMHRMDAQADLGLHCSHARSLFFKNGLDHFLSHKTSFLHN